VSIATIRMPGAPAKAATVAKRLGVRVERQLRQELTRFGLPLDLYDCVVERASIGEGPYYDGGRIGWYELPHVKATFTHRETGAEIVVTEIHTDDRGKILQFGTQYGALTL
jgi:hypothetical protein